MKTAIAVAFWLLVGAPLTITLRGYVVAQLWGWYVVPTIRAHPLTLAQGVGLHLFVALLAYQFIETPEFDKKPAGERYAQITFRSAFVSLITWGVGALVFKLGAM